MVPNESTVYIEQWLYSCMLYPIDYEVFMCQHVSLRYSFIRTHEHSTMILYKKYKSDLKTFIHIQ